MTDGEWMYGNGNGDDIMGSDTSQETAAAVSLCLYAYRKQIYRESLCVTQSKKECGYIKLSICTPASAICIAPTYFYIT